MSGPGGPRSPLFGTATFSSLTEGQRSPTRFSYSDRSGTPTHLSSDSGSGAPYRSQHTRSYTDPYTYTDENSIDDDAEVEAALGVLDDELDNTEDALTEWSRATPYSGSGSGYGTGSYLGSDTFTRSDTHSGTGSPSFIPSSFIPFTNTLRDGRILSTITERTEHPSTRPTSHNFSGSGSRPNSGATDPRRSGHSRHLTEPTIVIPDRPTPPPGRRTGDLIALFEERGGSSPGVSGHTRTGSMPGPMGPRSPSPYTTTNSISMPTFGTLSGSTSYGYGSTAGYGSGSASRPSSPTKTTQSRSTPTPGGARAPGEARSTTSYTASQTYNTNTFTPSSYTPSSYTPTVTNTVTPTASPLRRPQASPRSPLTSVRNIVAAWKERSTSGSKTSGSSTTSSTPQTGSGTTETQGDGFFSLRRRAERSSNRMRDSLGGDEAGPSGFGGGGNGGQRRSGEQVPSTPRSGSTSLSSSVIPPPFDLAELGNFAQADREPLRIGLLWYLNVHAPPPYRWQRCQALLYPHMLLLSWIAPGGGRGIITLDLLNCTEVRSVPSPMHPTARDDVGTIAAREQSALAARGGDGGGGGEGQLGEMGLMEMLCPFQLLYGDGVERLGAESARERVRWVSAIWEALDRSVTIPNRSDSGSPTGSIRTIHTMTSTHSAQSTNSGSRSTTFMPPIDNIPDISDLYSLSSHSSGTGAGTRATRRLSSGTGGGTRAADDASVANNTLLYPGDPRVIAPSRSSSLRRTSSMTDLDEEFDSALRRARESRPGLGFGLSLVGTHATGSGGLVGDGSPVTVSSGPRLGRDVVITPPPSSGRRSERSSSVSDDAFFSAGGPSTNTSSYYSLGDGSTTPKKTETMTGLGSGTEVSGEMLFGITSGTGTQIVPSSLSYRGPSSASLLGDSHSGSGTGSGTLMPPSSGLSRSRAMTRRSRGGSGSDLSYSSSSQSHPSEEISDRENTATGTRSGTASGDYSYSETGYSYGYTQTRTFTQTEGYTTTGYDSGTVSRTQTPYPTSSSERDDQEEYEQERTPTSTAFETAHEHSPSMASMSDLPNIPSEYDTADVCSTTYETARRCDTESIAETAEVCKTESVSDEGFVTAAVCKTESERSSEGFVTCDVCKSDASTDYETAICRCGRKPPSEAVSEPAQLTPVTMPSPLPEIQPRLPSPLPIERRDEAIETSPIPQVSPLPVIVPVPIVVEPEPEPEPVPQPQPEPSLPPSPSPLSSLPSLQPMTPEEVPLPPSAPASVSSFSLLSSPRALSDIDLGPSVTRSIPSDSLLDVPSSLPAPSPIGPPLSVPSTPLLSSITESSVTPGEIPDSERTPTSARARSARTPSSLSVRESLWAPETDMSYESSMLRASPSVQSVALPEGADLSFDTSFLRPTASVASGESLGSAMQAYDRLSTIPESVTSTSIPSGTPSSSISAPSIPSIPSSSSSSITPTPTESEQPQPPTPSISVSFPTTSVPSVESLERSVESLESPSPSVRSATVTVTRTPSSVSTVSSLRPGWDAVSEVDWDREGEGLEEVQTEPSLLSSVRSPTIRAMSPAFIPLPSSPSISTHLQTMSTPSMSTPSISISQSTPSSNIPSIHSNLDTVSSAPIIMHDINRLLGWLNEREGDRSRDNEGLHDHMRDIERQLNELGDFIRSKEEPPTAPPPVPRKERSVGGSSVISSSSWGSIEEAGPAPAGPRPRPGTTTPTIRRHRGIPRSGRTTAPPRHEYLDVGVGASPRRVRSLTPPPYRIPSPSSLSSSVSFLSSHHSDDFSLMESEVYPVGPSEPSSPESPSSSSSSSPPSTPSPVSVGLPETVISSSVETSGPYLSKTSSEEAAETPTPRPVPVSIPVPPSPSSSPSQSSSASSSTARPRVPIDLGPLRELLSNVKDQVEALWDGQLSTNHMLDELRGRRTPAQVEQDNEELIERLQRIEDALMRMADAQARAAPSAGPPPPPARESYYDSGSETSSELDGLRRRWNQLRQDMSAPALPAPTPLRAQSSLDALMADLLRPSERPPPPLVQPPPPLVPLIFRPDPRGGRPRSISPTMQTTLPPRAATTGPRDGVYIYDRPRPVRIRRRGDHPAPVTPSTPIVHPPQPQQVPQQPPRTTTTPAPPPGQVLGDGGIGPGVPPPGMVGGPMGPPEGPDIDFLREVRRRRDPTSSGFINVETPGEQPPRPPSAPASVSQGPWYTDRPPAQDGAPPPPPLHPHGLGDMGGAPPPVPPPFAAQPGPAVLQLPPIFNDMMTLLRDNRHMHLASLDQQRELMRYMTNLNDWLDRDVNDRQDEMRGVSARVSRLSDDINRLANALRPQGVPVPPMPIFGMPPGPPAQQGQQGQAGPWVVPPPGDMGRAGTAPPGPAGMPPPGQVMPPVMPGGPPITIQPPGGGPPYWIQPGVEPPVIPGSYASPSEEGFIPSPLSVRDDRPYAPDFSAAHPPPGVYQPPAPGQPGPSRPHGEEEIFVPSPPRMHHSPRPDSRSSRSSSSYVPVPPPGAGDITIFPPPPVPTGPLHTHTPRSDYSRSTTPSTHRHSPRQEYPPPPAAPSPPTVIHAPETYIPSQRPGTPRVGSPRHPDIQPQPQPIIIGPVPPPGTVGPGFQQPGGGQQIPVIISPPMAHSPAPQIIQMHPSSRRSSRSRLESPPIVVRDDGGPYTPTHQGYPTSQPYPAPTPQPVTVITQPPPTSYGPSRRPSYRSGRETPVLVAEPVVHIPSRRSPSYSPSPGRGYRRRYSPDYYRRRYRDRSHSPDYYYRRDRDRGRSRSRSPYDDRYRYRSRSPGDYRHGTRYRRGRSRSPEYYRTRYRSRSRSPLWYRARDFFRRGRSPSSDHYRHYRGRSHSPTFYRDRDREDHRRYRPRSPSRSPVYESGDVYPHPGPRTPSIIPSRRPSTHVPTMVEDYGGEEEVIQHPDFEHQPSRTTSRRSHVTPSHRPPTEVGVDSRGRTPTRYGQPYREWSHSPTWYRTRQRYPDRSPSTDYYQHHYAGRSQSPTHYQERDRADRQQYPGPQGPSRRTSIRSRVPTQIPSREPSPGVEEVPFSHRPSRAASHAPTEIPGFGYDEEPRGRPRSRTPSYTERYRSRSHSPEWYRRRDRHAHGRSASSDYYRRHYGDRSQSPLWYRARDREERAGGRRGSPIDTPYDPGAVPPRSRRSSAYVPPPGVEDVEDEDVEPLDREPTITHVRSEGAPSISHGALPTVVHVRGSPERGAPSTLYEHPQEGLEEPYEEGAHPSELEDLRQQIRRTPSGVPFIPSRSEGGASRPTAPGTAYGEDAPLSEEGIFEEDHTGAHPIPSGPSGPGDLAYDDAERARHERFGEVERQMLDLTRATEEAENAREDAFRHNEESRDRIFEENEARRDQEAGERRDEIWRDLEGRLATLPAPSPTPVPIPTEEPIPVPAGEEEFEEHSEGAEGLGSAERPASIIETIRSSARDAAVQRDTQIAEIVKGEREETARQFDAVMEDRRRHDEELAEERQRLHEERDRRIVELEEELARVRGELDNEKQLRITEEAERREMERAETIERDEAVRQQLGDITNLVQEQRDECQMKKELNEERWNEKLTRREEKKADMDALKEMMSEMLAVQRAAKEACEEDRANAVTKSDIEKIVEDLRLENNSLREMFETFTDSWTAENKKQYDELVQIIRDTAHEQVPFNVQGYLDEFSKSLAAEVRMLLGEVGKLREEKRALQHEMGWLLCMRSKYGPGGEFDPDWKPTGGPLAAQAEPAPPPEVPPPMPMEPPRTAWRNVTARTSRGRRRRAESNPPAPPPEAAPTMDPRYHQAGGSWATWQPDPNIEYTPPPTVPQTLLAPEAPRGLFGPRSPNNSVRGG